MTQTIADRRTESGTRMKAWIQEGEGTADVLQPREIERPTITADQVLVRVRATSVNAADYHSVHGVRMANLIGKLMRFPPAGPIRGSDVSGVVVETGANVTSLREGDEWFGLASGAYKLRLSADGEHIEWVETKPDGQQIVHTREPDGPWLLKLKQWLFAPFVSDDLL